MLGVQFVHLAILALTALAVEKTPNDSERVNHELDESGEDWMIDIPAGRFDGDGRDKRGVSGYPEEVHGMPDSPLPPSRRKYMWRYSRKNGFGCPRANNKYCFDHRGFCHPGTCVSEKPLQTCDCDACDDNKICKKDHHCGYVPNACVNGLCDCFAAYVKNGFNGTRKDLKEKVCNEVSCSEEVSYCYGMPCNIGVCQCPTQ